MKSYEMEIGVVYKVTKESSDGTFQVDDVVWISDNKDINVISISGGGFLAEEEWTSPESFDFEAEVDHSHKLFKHGHNEYVMNDSD